MFAAIVAAAATDPRAAAIVAASRQAAAPRDNGAADWTPNTDLSRDNRFWQTSLKIGYDISPDVTLTSLTSYLKYDHHQGQDPDGQPLEALGYVTDGKIESFFQELRLNGTGVDGRLQWVVGANYARDRADQFDDVKVNATVSYVFRPFVDYYSAFGQKQTQRFTTKAVFGNIDFAILDTVKAHAGMRYTDSKDSFRGCSTNTGDGGIGTGLAAIFSLLRAGAGLGPVSIAPGGCTVADSNFKPVDIVESQLKEDNISWRVGLDWEPADRTLLYANVSKGYKAGNYPQLAATADAQFIPARQESLLAYEVGFKSTLFDRRLQLNGALFYYDYRDKQVRGRTAPLPPFGPLETLVNVPKSRIKGAELSVTWMPVERLTINGGVTYLDSRINGDFNDYTPFGKTGNFRGERLPLTPKWLWTISGDYRVPFNEQVNMFVGTSINYQGKTNGAFGNRPTFDIPSYTLVDLRAGLETADRNWSLTLWGRNVFDKYYYTNVFYGVNQVVRFTGKPATYGLTLSYRM